MNNPKQQIQDVCEEELTLEKGLYAYCKLPKGHKGIHDPHQQIQEKLREERFDEITDGWYGGEEKSALLSFIQAEIALALKEQRSEIVEMIEKRIEHWQKVHDESMPHNTLIGYHADSCIRALDDIISSLIKDTK